MGATDGPAYAFSLSVADAVAPCRGPAPRSTCASTSRVPCPTWSGLGLGLGLGMGLGPGLGLRVRGSLSHSLQLPLWSVVNL